MLWEDRNQKKFHSLIASSAVKVEWLLNYIKCESRILRTSRVVDVMFKSEAF